MTGSPQPLSRRKRQHVVNRQTFAQARRRVNLNFIYARFQHLRQPDQPVHGHPGTVRAAFAGGAAAEGGRFQKDFCGATFHAPPPVVAHRAGPDRPRSGTSRRALMLPSSSSRFHVYGLSCHTHGQCHLGAEILPANGIRPAFNRFFVASLNRCYTAPIFSSIATGAITHTMLNGCHDLWKYQ